MRLVSAVLGFALSKLGLFGALMVSLFFGYLLVQVLVPTLREAVADQERLEQMGKERAALENDLDELRRAAAESRREAVASLEGEIEAEIAKGRRDFAAKKAEIKNLREDRDGACGFWQKVGAVVLPGNACKAAEAAVAKANDVADALEGTLKQAEDDAAVLADPGLSPEQKLARIVGGEQSSVEREMANSEAELAQRKAEEDNLAQAQSSGVGWVVYHWAQSWRWLAALALLVLVLPFALRLFSYFVLMPVVSRVHTPIRLSEGSEIASADLRFSAAERTLTVDLGEGEVLSARGKYVRPVQGKVRSRLLYDWKAPFVSFAAGLNELSRITGDGRVTSATLASPDDPDSYLMRIDFQDHPGLVMHPKHVVGVIGTPDLQVRWRWGIQSFATWQVRYIMFAGTGSLIVQGVGDVAATDPRGRATRMDQNLVMGFDSRLTVGVNRTEAFWPYLRGKTPLVVDEFTGLAPLFWQKSSREEPKNPIAKTFDALFSGFGKLLGF